MNVAEVTAKAKVLLEALPYIQDFRGSTFVVKYGGSFMDDPNPANRTRVAYDIAFFAAVGINVVKKTLDEVVNKEVCAAIISAQGKPKGLPGDSVLVCQKLTQDDDGRPIDLGFVGDVTEVKVKLIKKEIADGFIPVISPVAEGYDGKPYNVNADLVAGRVASALRARRLVYMSDVPGLLSAPPDPESLISTLKTSQVEDLKKKGVIDKGMRPKVQSAIRALEEGVQRVHFIDGRLAHSLLLEIFTDKGIGTEIVLG